MKRVAFFVSDGTGLTAEALGRSLLSQFGHIDFEQITIPYISTKEGARAVVKRINKVLEESGLRPIVFDTIVNEEVREIVTQCEGFTVDIFDTFIKPLEKEFNADSSYSVGKSHAITNQNVYNVRLSAIDFALENDDGARTRHYDKADIILIGVSRSGKTPTSLYLALQFGIRAANYPLTEDDLDETHLPKTLKEYKNKLFGLTIDSDRLTSIRNERMSNSRYASFSQCEAEVRGAEAMFNKERVPYLNTTDISIEEISTRILATSGIERRLQS
jgi:regulator of PEP synthase PpsR (kinase-PPPase family)